MTGFGAVEGTVGPMRAHVEARSVNHRFFSPSIKLPTELARWEPDVREALRRTVARGAVTLVVHLEREPAGTPLVDEARFASFVRLLRELRDRYGLAGDVDVATVLRMPDVLGAVPVSRETGDAGPELIALVETAARALVQSRAAEGHRLTAVLRDRLAAIDQAIDQIAARAPARVVEERDRRRAAVMQLLDGAAVDETRLAQEIALLAERIDVQEEIDRFRAHVGAFTAALRAETAEPVGKRLGFLLQEMLREANTTGSKAADGEIVREVLRIKEELERLREQVENIE